MTPEQAFNLLRELIRKLQVNADVGDARDEALKVIAKLVPVAEDKKSE